MTTVLQRDGYGRPLLWQCCECGEPFGRPPHPLGWGDVCNKCISVAERHREVVEAIKSLKEITHMERVK
jgi:hypothetical protein